MSRCKGEGSCGAPTVPNPDSSVLPLAMVTWNAVFYDFNNDGWEDLYVAGGPKSQALLATSSMVLDTTVFSRTALAWAKSHSTQTSFAHSVYSYGRCAPFDEARNPLPISHHKGTLRRRETAGDCGYIPLSLDAGVSSADGFPARGPNRKQRRAEGILGPRSCCLQLTSDMADFRSVFVDGILE